MAQLPRVRSAWLASTLLLRGSIHAGFAAWLLIVNPGWTRVFEVGAWCGLADGTLGLVIVALIAPAAPTKSPRFLTIMTFLDAIGRIGSGAALLAFPGIPGFFVTMGLLFGVIGVCVAAVGLVALIAWMVRRVRAGRSWSITDDELFDPLAVASVAAFVVGYTLFMNPPTDAGALRLMGAIVCGVLTLVFLVAAIGARRLKGPA